MHISQAVTLKNAHGLHARALCLFVETCQGFASDIQVSREGIHADGKSILEVMTLGAVQGTVLVLDITGEDASRAAAALLALVEDLADEGSRAHEIARPQEAEPPKAKRLPSPHDIG